MFAIAYCSDNLVAPFTGAWIEIFRSLGHHPVILVAPFTGAWIEILFEDAKRDRIMSLPSRERGLKSNRSYKV